MYLRRCFCTNACHGLVEIFYFGGNVVEIIIAM